METQGSSREIDIHLLKLRYGHTRISDSKAAKRLRNSMERFGQLEPIVTVKDSSGRFVLIDGYLRVSVLKELCRDVAWIRVKEGGEAEALLEMLRNTRRRSWAGMELAALICELHSRFEMSYSEIGRKCGRDKSWVKRKADLLESLPEEILQTVMQGGISTWSASRVLAPLARANGADALKLTEKLLAEPLSTRELARFYEHYKRSNRAVRKRMVEAPALFIKTIRQQEQEREARQINNGPEGKWLKDITLVCHILKRLLSDAGQAVYPGQAVWQRRQLQIWIEKAGKLVAELKQETERRRKDGYAESETDHPGDEQKRSWVAGNLPDLASLPQHGTPSCQRQETGPKPQAIEA